MKKKHISRHLKSRRLIIITLVALLGGIILASSQAATVSISREAEPPDGSLSGCVSVITDNEASGGKAVKFGGCNNNAGGKNIPDTNYPIPSGAIYMATNGNDSSPGTQAAPVKTIAKAISITPSGGTIVIRGGTYRDGTTNRINKPITLQPYPHEKVWFDGMDVPTGWVSIGGNQWSLDWNTPSFCNGKYYDKPFRAQDKTAGPCTYADQYGDTSNPMSADPQMVYVDGVYVHEVATKAEANGSNFYYDQTNKKVILGLNPAGHTVEVTARPTALFIEGGSGNVVIRGLGFAHYASDNFPEAAGYGAIIVNSPYITLENNVIAENAGAGVQTVNPLGGNIRNNSFYRNGGNGLHANNGNKSVADNLMVENNVFDGNNAEKLGVGCNYSCQAAGFKMNHMVGTTIRKNIFQNSAGEAHGFWCDMSCIGVKIYQNISRNNGGSGFYYEISDTGIIASNLIVGNGKYGIKMGSSNTKIYNNTVVNNGIGALIYDDNRSPTADSWCSGTKNCGPDTTNVSMANNIFSGNKGNIVQSWRTKSGDSYSTGPNTFYSLYDYNSYYRNGTSPNISEWKDPSTTLYNSVSALKSAKGKEANGQDITSGSDPFFVDANGGNYTVRTNSVAYNTGTTLPSDIASLLGIPTNPVSRGAINWIGK